MTADLGRQEPAPWPGGAEAAVSLSFDDGLLSQFDLAVRQTAAFGLLATFYVVPSEGPIPGAPEGSRQGAWRERLEPWRAVQEAGHEIGNHSLTHPCSENGMRDRRGLELMTLGDIESEIIESQRRMDEVLGPRSRSFAFPCYQSHVGIGKDRQSYVPVVARHFPAARGRGDKPNSARNVDLHDIWSWPAERKSGPELIGLCEWAALEGRWAVLTFHGVDEGHLPVNEFDLSMLLRHLDRHRDRLWTAPVLTVADHIASWRMRPV